MALESLTVDRIVAGGIRARSLEAGFGQLCRHRAGLAALPVGVEHPDARGVQCRRLDPIECPDGLRLQSGLLGHSGHRTGDRLCRGVTAPQRHSPHEASEDNRYHYEKHVRGAEAAHPPSGGRTRSGLGAEVGDHQWPSCR